VPACNVIGTDVDEYMDSNNNRITYFVQQSDVSPLKCECERQNSTHTRLIGRDGTKVIAIRIFSNADKDASVGEMLTSLSLSSCQMKTNPQ
jgi:hypothetical protein